MRIRRLLFLEFINIVFIFVLYVYRIHDIAIYFFSDLFCLIQGIYELSDSFRLVHFCKFSKFSRFSKFNLVELSDSFHLVHFCKFSKFSKFNLVNLVNFWMCYLHLLVQELLVIFEAFV